jgi:hypothetical protein
MSDAREPSRRSEVYRPHLGIVFKCCKVYARVYLNSEKDAYVGWCPRCAGKLVVPVAPNGSDARFFEAG